MTTSPQTAALIQPPVTSLTDRIRLAFHQHTGIVLPESVCQACWVSIVALVTETIQPRDVLEVEHACPPYVEPVIVLYHALRRLPEEDYWKMPDPWSARA